MSKLRQITLISVAILITSTAVACGAAPSTVAPVPENTPLPGVTATLENTPLPAATSVPATPTMQGAIDVGGYKLVYECFGQGSPAIIVEAGGGDRPVISLTWKTVVQGVQATTRICIYDRVDGVRTSQDIAEDLHVLLGKIPVPGPYILVAHSIGGFHARVFAHEYPEEMAGMILVDTTTLFPDTWIALATAYPTYAPDEAPGITQERMSEAEIYTTTMPANMATDGLDISASNEQVRQAGSLGDLPLVVISHDPNLEAGIGLDPAVKAVYAATTLKLQAELAGLSSKGVFRIANTPKHFISLFDPRIIIDAMTGMVEEIRNQP